MATRTYLARGGAAFVMLSRILATHYSAMRIESSISDVTVDVTLPTVESALVLDSIMAAVNSANPEHVITRIERGESYIKVEKESTFGTPVAPQRRWTTKPLDIQPAPDPAAASKMTDQIAAIWPNLEPLEQRMTLAELTKNTPMTRAEIQAQITGLIERLVAEGVKERTQS